MAILLSSHLLSEVELVCDRVVFLSRGEIVRSGPPSELVSQDAVEVETDDGTLRFPGAARDDVPGILADLFESGARVYGVRAVSATLEEVYLEAVGDQVT